MTIKDITIRKDSTSLILKDRWLACYMLYDWNIAHAHQTFDYNEQDRFQKVAKLLEGAQNTKEGIDKALTELYNKILADDTESYIQTHMQVMKVERPEVELIIAKAMSEICPYIHRH